MSGSKVGILRGNERRESKRSEGKFCVRKWKREVK